jgi:hypothetical protein
MSKYGEDEEINGNDGLTQCVMYQGRPWSCGTNTNPLMGAQSTFQMGDPAIFMSFEIGNFLGELQSPDPDVTSTSAKIVHEQAGDRVIACLSASVTRSNGYPSERLHVCLTPSGVPLTFSESGVDTAVTETDITATALSATVVAEDFRPPVPSAPGD